MTDITIPPEVIKAAARARWQNQHGYNDHDARILWNAQSSWRQDQLLDDEAAAWKAGLKAWPGMDHMTSGAPDAVDCVILPLLQEIDNA